MDSFYFFTFFIFLIISALVSAIETSLRNIDLKKIKELSESGNLQAHRLNELLKKPVYVLGTIMITNNLVNVSIVSLVYFQVFNYDFFKTPIGFVASVIVTSIILFTFSGLFPKTVGSRNPESVAMKLSMFLKVFCVIFKPFVFITDKLAGSLLKSIVDNFGSLMKQFSEDDIKNMVEMGHETGALEQYETKIIKSALTIDELPVSSILTPRVDIECISVDSSIEDTLELMLKEEYSRMPVYEENIDNIVGIIHVKDLFKAAKDVPENMKKNIKSLVREVYHIPENKTIIDLLKEMQAKRVQMAIVSDEYGGTAGLITMEDILEEIVGEIRDEHDIDEMPSIFEIDKNSIIVDAMVSVSEINRLLKLNLPNNQTIGRLVFDSLGEVPKPGQTLNFENSIIKVKEVDGLRVQKILIEKKNLALQES